MLPLIVELVSERSDDLLNLAGFERWIGVGEAGFVRAFATQLTSKASRPMPRAACWRFKKEGEIVRENDNLPAPRFSHEARLTSSSHVRRTT